MPKFDLPEGDQRRSCGVMHLNDAQKEQAMIIARTFMDESEKHGDIIMLLYSVDVINIYTKSCLDGALNDLADATRENLAWP